MATSLILLNILFSGEGGFIYWFFGGIDMLAYVLFVVIVVEYISLIMRGVLYNELRCLAGVRKIFQKILIFLLVGVGNIIDTHIFGNDTPILKTAITIFYIANQGISLLENATIIGLPVPKMLKDILVKLHKEEKSD